jgi:hypothetical protein
MTGNAGFSMCCFCLGQVKDTAADSLTIEVRRTVGNERTDAPMQMMRCHATCLGSALAKGFMFDPECLDPG